jgi:hypothetical protein
VSLRCARSMPGITPSQRRVVNRRSPVRPWAVRSGTARLPS